MCDVHVCDAAWLGQHLIAFQSVVSEVFYDMIHGYIAIYTNDYHNHRIMSVLWILFWDNYGAQGYLKQLWRLTD